MLTTLGLYFRVREGDQRLRRRSAEMALERAERESPPTAPAPGPVDRDAGSHPGRLTVPHRARTGVRGPVYAVRGDRGWSVAL